MVGRFVLVKHAPLSFLSGVIFITAINPWTTAVAAPSPRVSLTYGEPRVITAARGTVCRKPSTISFKLRVQGIAFSSKTSTTNPLKGRGHIQVYLDRLPANAAKKRNFTHWIGSIPSDTFSLCLPLAALSGKTGKHKLFFALAKTNSVLYAVKPASFSFIGE